MHDNYISGAHNFIIDSFVQSGILGVITILTSIILAIKGIQKEKVNNFYGLKLFILLILIYSLYEASFFNKITDFILWFILGSLNYEYLISKKA